MPLFLCVITRNPTKLYAEFGAFEYVVINLVSETVSVLMKITFSHGTRTVHYGAAIGDCYLLCWVSKVPGVSPRGIA